MNAELSFEEWQTIRASVEREYRRAYRRAVKGKELAESSHGRRFLVASGRDKATGKQYPRLASPCGLTATGGTKLNSKASKSVKITLS